MIIHLYHVSLSCTHLDFKTDFKGVIKRTGVRIPPFYPNKTLNQQKSLLTDCSFLTHQNLFLIITLLQLNLIIR